MPGSSENATCDLDNMVLSGARVLCVQRRMTHYRVPLFERVRERLASAGVRFEVAYGDPTSAEMAKRDEGRLDWGTHVPCRYFFGGRLCWQNNIDRKSTRLNSSHG